MPLLKLMPIKKGSKIVQVPVVIRHNEQRSVALRWILEAARKRHESTSAKLKHVSLADCLAAELVQASQCKGAAREKRDAVHKVGMESRAHLARG